MAPVIWVSQGPCLRCVSGGYCSCDAFLQGFIVSRLTEFLQYVCRLTTHTATFAPCSISLLFIRGPPHLLLYTLCWISLLCIRGPPHLLLYTLCWISRPFNGALLTSCFIRSVELVAPFTGPSSPVALYVLIMHGHICSEVKWLIILMHYNPVKHSELIQDIEQLLQSQF